MKLILVRHAIAEDRDQFGETGRPDEERPLTDDGARKMKRAARGLAVVVGRVDVIASSPLTRAVQTAELLAKRYKGAPVVVAEALAPERPFDEFLLWLQRLEDADSVIAIGHEPHLGSLGSWLLTGDGQSRFEMKKGSALLLEFDGEVKPAGARLGWFLTPSQLRLIGD